LALISVSGWQWKEISCYWREQSLDRPVFTVSEVGISQSGLLTHKSDERLSRLVLINEIVSSKWKTRTPLSGKRQKSMVMC
jgi:hypothetical protein